MSLTSREGREEWKLESTGHWVVVDDGALLLLQHLRQDHLNHEDGCNDAHVDHVVVVAGWVLAKLFWRIWATHAVDQGDNVLYALYRISHRLNGVGLTEVHRENFDLQYERRDHEKALYKYNYFPNIHLWSGTFPWTLRPTCPTWRHCERWAADWNPLRQTHVHTRSQQHH